MKICKECNLVKELSAFGIQKSCADGLRTSCKECRKIESKKWYECKKEELSEYYAVKYLENKEVISSRNNKWKKDNPSKRAAYKANRRAAELGAMPKWADIEKIKRFYRLAKVMSLISVHKYHVDHIIPLQGKKVCVFHIETNLQVIKASDNLIKGNKYE